MESGLTGPVIGSVGVCISVAPQRKGCNQLTIHLLRREERWKKWRGGGKERGWNVKVSLKRHREEDRMKASNVNRWTDHYVLLSLDMNLQNNSLPALSLTSLEGGGESAFRSFQVHEALNRSVPPSCERLFIPLLRVFKDSRYKKQTGWKIVQCSANRGGARSLLCFHQSSICNQLFLVNSRKLTIRQMWDLTGRYWQLLWNTIHSSL